MYRGHKLSDLAQMNMDSLIELLPTRRRRTLKRGLPPRQKKLLMKLRAARKQARKGKDVIVKTHCRDMVILPEMVDLTIGVHNGKDFVSGGDGLGGEVPGDGQDNDHDYIADENVGHGTHVAGIIGAV